MSHDESCADFLESIVYLLDNELSAPDVDSVRAHLEDCAPCLQSYELQSTVKALVARSCIEHAPESLRQRVRIQIQEIQVRYTES
jgi:mycothiol system anti-sigma-R factor